MPKLAGLLVFTGLFSVIYYKKLLSVKEGESKKIEMIKHVLVVFIILGLLNTLTITTDENYKALVLVIIICLINIYNGRHIFKYCPNIPFQFKITQYIRMTIVIIVLAILIKYTNEHGLLTLIYKDSTVGGGGDKGKVERELEKLRIKLSDNLPSFCPDMNKDKIDWGSLAQPSQQACINKHNEINQRLDLASNIYA